MNKIEFKIQMDRLISEYDNGAEKKFYGEQRTAAIFKCFQNYSIGQFTEIVDRAFISEKFAPLAKDLLRISEEARVSRHNQIKTQNTKPWDGLTDSDPTLVKESIENVFNILRGKRN